MQQRIEDIHGIGPTVAQAEALEYEMWRVRSAEAPHIEEMVSRGIVRELALPAAQDHSSHVRYVRHQGAYGCGMNAAAAVWDILNDMYSPPNFHPNVSVNRMIWAWHFPLLCEPAGQPCGQRTPSKIPGLKGTSYMTLDDYLHNEGCATEGSELTNSDAVQWPTDEGNHEMSNFRQDRHGWAKPGEYVASVPVTVNNLRYCLAGGPVRVGIWNNHFVALVGYDDTAKHFKFVNSWGDQWGENGFGYVDYSALNTQIQSAQLFAYIPPKTMPCLRVKFSHTWRQDVYLWIGVEGTMKCKRIWPTGQRQDDSHNLWLTVTLPEGFAWPPAQQNRVYLDIYDCGAHSSSGGLIEEVLTGYNGNYLASADLAGGPVPFKPGKVIRLTVP